MTLQGIAAAAGVSKALLLYHFESKTALLDAVVSTLGLASAGRLRAAAISGDAMTAWRAIVADEPVRGERALFAALALEAEVGAEALQRVRAEREAAATELAIAMLRGLQLSPSVPAMFLGRLLLRQLDGLAVASTHNGIFADGLDAEIDAVTLALLSLGR